NSKCLQVFGTWHTGESDHGRFAFGHRPDDYRPGARAFRGADQPSRGLYAIRPENAGATRTRFGAYNCEATYRVAWWKLNHRGTAGQRHSGYCQASSTAAWDGIGFGCLLKPSYWVAEQFCWGCFLPAGS